MTASSTIPLDVYAAYANVMRENIQTAFGLAYYNTPTWKLVVQQQGELATLQNGVNGTVAGSALLAANTAAALEIGHWADATTSVVTLSYEFFTGKTVTADGYDYLVHSPANMNGLTYSYYAQFNLENRYINIASNLGKAGAGAASFAADYGGLSLFEATRKAYDAIFGTVADDAKVHALIDTRVDYFAAYGGDGPNGIGTKAAMVGWLLAEAVKADVGTYAQANDAYLVDLASGAATYNTDILSLYGHGAVPLIGDHAA